MKSCTRLLLLSLSVVYSLFILFSGRTTADEGMWLTENPPHEILRSRYGFDCTDAWMEHLRRSSVRFGNGGSGSFCSPDGLVVTNHHVGAGPIYKLSTPERDLLANGFYAPNRDAELPCHDLELNVLYSIEDVTTRVKDAVKTATNAASGSASGAVAARRAVIATIEQEATERTGLRCDVVTLYRGGRYHLYCYKRYTDVRLVFAPEQQAAFFGGDPDNFEYPRYDLDIAFFRVYENGLPAKIDDYLTWNSNGSREDDLIFVSGHPGRTDRLNTVDHLEYIRDRQLPETMAQLYRREVLLKAYATRNPENMRRANSAIKSVENGRKVRGGMLNGLQTPSVIEAKREVEKQLRAAYIPATDATYSPWEKILRATAAESENLRGYSLFEGGTAFQSRLFSIARTLVRLADENEKTNDQRLPEYRDSARTSLEQSLFSAAPIHADLETLTLGDSLAMALEQRRDCDPWIEKNYGGYETVIFGDHRNTSPREFAAALVAGTQLADVEYRRELVRGGRAAIETSDDPMIRLARKVDEVSRQYRRMYEEIVDEPMKQAYAEIAELQFERLGDSVYPDATFTLRLAFGTVVGYEERGADGKNAAIPAYTAMGGMFDRSAAMGGSEPFDLPPSWTERRDRIEPTTPFNFVSTADIIGGNSGSPVVDREGRFVGIIFDGNIPSLVLDYCYTDKQARATSVDVRAILESLRKIYDAEELVQELKLSE